MSGLVWSEIKAHFCDVDSADALERATHVPALAAALDATRPRNWWGSGIPAERLIQIATNEGIPVAWLPSQEIIRELAGARDRDARVAILLARQAEILEHCGELLGECSDPWVADEHFLVTRAFEALVAGHHEAAMALAVSVGEPLSIWASTPRVSAFGSEDHARSWEDERGTVGKYSLVEAELRVQI